MTGETIRIRSATVDDARDVYRLIRENPENLVPRPLNDIVKNIDRFMVATDVRGQLAGTVAYNIHPEIGDPGHTAVELCSVCVRDTHRHLGIGRRLVLAALRRIREFHPRQIVVLTFTPPFFESIGFHRIDKKTLMYKIYSGCINCTKHESPFTCPEVAMALDRAQLDDALQAADDNPA